MQVIDISVCIFSPMTLTPPSLIITIIQHFGSGITSKYVPIKYSHALHISFSLFDCTYVCVCVHCINKACSLCGRSARVKNQQKQ